MGEPITFTVGMFIYFMALASITTACSVVTLICLGKSK